METKKVIGFDGTRYSAQTIHPKPTCGRFLQALLLPESSPSALPPLLPKRWFSSDVNTEQHDFCEGSGKE